MIDPEHLNDLAEMTVGPAARAAFLHAASAEGLTERSFTPLTLDLYSLLVYTVGERCTSQDVSCAVCIAMARERDERDSEDNITEADFDPGDGGEGSPCRIVPVEKFVREAAAALAALSKYEIGERVRVGRDRTTAVPAVIVSKGHDDWEWYIAERSGGTPRREDSGFIWRAPLTRPTPMPTDRGKNGGES